ncbi:hypothetical protein IMZ11_27430 [Microtetraspora sp. AC03309]|uniref:hypothetical protein n=1 Tax=Microtetraspora sp. AC03309 TaxID=2779376 RepID=UPI001E622D50|nr:hypothetical protein [Microtetraspora sp. AC03309]MCC5579368.1 hypothetical protein [Microtetraspora sp. AC03309]
MTPHAEVEQVWPRDGRVRIVGRVHGIDPDPGACRLILVLREHKEQEVHAEAELDGHGFDVSVPIGDLVPAYGPLTGVWDAYLAVWRAGGERRLRVGRLLDDIPDKNKVMVFPAQAVPVDDRRVLVRPRYTVRNNLSVDYEWSEG